MKSNLIGVILLAAGASRRLGTAKQSLAFQGSTLLRRSAETALLVSGAVVVALGARRAVLRAEIADLPVTIVENKDWERGMGGSLKIGLDALLETNEKLRAVVVMVCDQPFVSVELLERIVAVFQATNAPVVACRYADTLGVPALFSAELFPELHALEPSHGAKTLIAEHRRRVVPVEFPEGAFDIDTPEDYARLLAHLT